MADAKRVTIAIMITIAWLALTVLSAVGLRALTEPVCREAIDGD